MAIHSQQRLWRTKATRSK